PPSRWTRSMAVAARMDSRAIRYFGNIHKIIRAATVMERFRGLIANPHKEIHSNSAAPAPTPPSPHPPAIHVATAARGTPPPLFARRPPEAGRKLAATYRRLPATCRRAPLTAPS